MSVHAPHVDSRKTHKNKAARGHILSVKSDFMYEAQAAVSICSFVFNLQHLAALNPGVHNNTLNTFV